MSRLEKRDFLDSVHVEMKKEVFLPQLEFFVIRQKAFLILSLLIGQHLGFREKKKAAKYK